MANTPSLNTKKETMIVLSDEQGKPILQVGHEEYMIRDSNKTLTKRSISENILLADKFFWNPTMLQARPPVFVACCYYCRKKGHGIVTLHRSKYCAKCGRLCCPAHRKLKDNQWLCLGCSKKHFLISLIRPIFFQKKDD